MHVNSEVSAFMGWVLDVCLSVRFLSSTAWGWHIVESLATHHQLWAVHLQVATKCTEKNPGFKQMRERGWWLKLKPRLSLQGQINLQKDTYSANSIHNAIMSRYLHTCIHAHMHTWIHAYVPHAHMHTCMHACMHARIHACIYAYIHA